MWGALIGAGASLLGASMQSRAADRASDAQVEAAEKNIKFQQGIYDDQKEMFQPYYNSGTNALNAYNYEMGLGDKPQGHGGFQTTPGYDFRMQQGVNALEGSAAASGGLYSGRTMKALQDYGQGTASQEYGNYMNRLSGLAGSGQSAAGQQATAAGNLGQSVGAAYGDIGNAQAAGAIGQANAWSGGINNALSTYGYMQGMGGAGGGGNALVPGGNLFSPSKW